MASDRKIALITEYHIVLGSRNTTKVEEAVKELQSVPGIKGTVSSTQIDVTDGESADTAAERVGAEYGRLNTLVNNAGLASMASPPARKLCAGFWTRTLSAP
ncbi:hypothetical protein ACO1O0_008526 [Amphichorda felina]